MKLILNIYMSTMIVWQSLRLLGPTVYEEMHSNKKKTTLFDLDFDTDIIKAT